jgi:hypothetical protein
MTFVAPFLQQRQYGRLEKPNPRILPMGSAGQGGNQDKDGRE